MTNSGAERQAKGRPSVAQHSGRLQELPARFLVAGCRFQLCESNCAAVLMQGAIFALAGTALARVLALGLRAVTLARGLTARAFLTGFLAAAAVMRSRATCATAACSSSVAIRASASLFA